MIQKTIVAQLSNSCTKVAHVFRLVQLSKIAQVTQVVKTKNVENATLNRCFYVKKFLQKTLNIVDSCTSCTKCTMRSIYVRAYVSYQIEKHATCATIQ